MVKQPNEPSGGDAALPANKGPATFPTDPSDDPGLSLPPADPVVALHVVGTEHEIPLAPSRKIFSLGSAKAPDILHVSSRMVKGADYGLDHVSSLHVLVQRKGNRLRVRDQGSTNGTFLDDRREDEFEIAAGKSFRMGDVTLLALDEMLQQLRPRLQWALGLSANAMVDKALEVIATGDAIALVGPADCDQLGLARDIHATSARRQHAFVAVEPPLATRREQTAILEHAAKGSAYLDVSRFGDLPAYFVSHLFADAYHVRPIVAARDLDAIAKHLGHAHTNKLRIIAMPAIADRRADVPRLLEMLFREAGSKRRIEELGTENVARLMSYTWSGNFEELRRWAPRLAAILDHGGVRAAARALNMSHSTLLDWLDRVGIRLRAE